MGGFHWQPEEIAKFNEAVKVANGDVKTFIYEMRKANTQRSLAQLYSRLNKLDTRPNVESAALLAKQLSSKARRGDGTIRPSAMKPLPPLVNPAAAAEVEAMEDAEAHEAGSVEYTVPLPLSPTKAPVVDDSVTLKHIAYCVLGQQLGRTDKILAYDQIVDVLKQRGIVR